MNNQSLLRSSLLISFLLLLASVPSWNDPEADPRIFTGRVVDQSGPVEGAIVRVAATNFTDVTGPDGTFRIEYSGAKSPQLVTAWKTGYYNGGMEIELRETNLEISLSPLPGEDNPAYEWIDPAPNPAPIRFALSLVDENQRCGDCHASIIYEQWKNNGHARAATNPQFLNLYNGTDAEGKEGVHPGFRLDYPHSVGNCSNCHAPAAAFRNLVGVDMNRLEGVEKLGVSCDFCHKVKDVWMKENTSRFTGVMHMELRRPPEGRQMFFGPYDDVPEPDAYSPLVSESLFCAPCHEGGFWGVPIYESYSEWLASPYAEKNITCQDCHMKPDGVTTNFAPDRGGLERDPETIPSHFQFGSRDSAFLASAVKMKTTGAVVKGELIAQVAITNVFAGHHIPTDQPMRNMILLVIATDHTGRALEYIGESRVPYWGGSGDPAEGNFEGLPGKGFAKILYERNPQYVSSAKSELQRQVLPAPQWRIVDILEDNRIPATATDSSVYGFTIDNAEFPVTIRTELIYRRTFKNWAAMKNWDIGDVILARNVITVGTK